MGHCPLDGLGGNRRGTEDLSVRLAPGRRGAVQHRHVGGRGRLRLYAGGFHGVVVIIIHRCRRIIGRGRSVFEQVEVGCDSASARA